MVLRTTDVSIVVPVKPTFTAKIMSVTPNTRKHFVLLPFPAFGHIIPLLELGKKISEYHDVTFMVYQSKADDFIRRQILRAGAKGIEILIVDDGVDVDLENNLKPKVVVESLNLMSPFQTKFFENVPKAGCQVVNQPSSPVKKPVDAIIVDSMFIVPIEVAFQREIPAYMFVSPAAWTFLGMLRFDETTKAVPDDEFFKSGLPVDNSAPWILESFKEWALRSNRALGKTTGVLVNSFAELEPNAISEFSASALTVGTSLRFVGPLLPTAQENTSAEQSIVGKQVQEWLDGKDDRSVVYVSFGSLAAPVPAQISAILQTLLSLKRPFVWSVKSTEKINLAETLQEKLESEYGKLNCPGLILRWAPQKTVLAHQATAVFVTHCGWNSSLEAISYGVPIVAWPMFGDQHLNADFLVKRGMGKRIPDTGLNAERIIPALELSEAITAVGGWAAGHSETEFFLKARELSQQAKESIATGGSTHRFIMDLVM